MSVTEDPNEDFAYPESPAPKPPIARRIRDFFETLFPDKLVIQLRDELNETRHERDYFKGRAERLELLLTQPRVANRDLSDPAKPREPRAHSSAIVGGRKTWFQVVAERRKQLAAAAEGRKQDAAAKAHGESAKTSAPAPSARN